MAYDYDDDLRKARLLLEEYKIQNQVNLLVEEYNLKPIKVILSGKLLYGFGKAVYDVREIRINPNLVGNELLDDTIKHEFAHFLAWDTFNHGGHGRHWKMCAIKVGAKPEQYVDSTQSAAQTVQRQGAKYIYKCSEGCEILAFRKWRRKMQCNKHRLSLTLTTQLR